MSCKLEDARPDWKAYTLGELDAPARREAEAHAAACSACRDEAAGWRVTLDAMAVLKEEELPRRIAFVSDKVFEPSWWRRLTQSFLRPSFAAAGLIAAAILVHAFVRPAAAPVNLASERDTAAIEARVTSQITAQVTAQVTDRVSRQIQAEMAAAVNTAVAKAVADTEKRDDQRTARLLAGTEQRYADAAEYLNKEVTHMYALNTGAGVR
jgi:anti-sigma factor RsiW